MGALAPGDLPPAIDLEEAYLKKDTNHDHEFWKTIPPRRVLANDLCWLTRVERGVGRKPIIYSRDNFLENLLGENVRELAPYPLWIAHYTDAPQPRIPFAWRNWTFWQYAQDGTVCGVSGKVDIDHFNGAVDDLKSFGRKARPAVGTTLEMDTSLPLNKSRNLIGMEWASVYHIKGWGNSTGTMEIFAPLLRKRARKERDGIQTAELEGRDQVTATKPWPSFLRKGYRGRFTASGTC